MEERMVQWFIKNMTTMTPAGWMEDKNYKWFQDNVKAAAKEQAKSLYLYLYGPQAYLDVEQYYTEEYCEEG